MSSSSPASGANPAQLRRLVDGAKKSRINRLYCKKYFNITDIKQAGIVPTESQWALDRPGSAGDEALRLFGFDEGGSYFHLSISIVKLSKCSPNRLFGRLEFVYIRRDENCKYSYECEELLDGQRCGNLVKIGSVTLETVVPFALSRILINGMVNVQKIETNKEEQKVLQSPVPIKLAISTHPTCDKFDYKYLFSKKYLMRVLTSGSLNGEQSIDQALGLLLDDRIDQPLMFQGQLDRLDSIESQNKDDDDDAKGKSAATGAKFIMWGAKTKQFLEPARQVVVVGDSSREFLFVWAESGQQIHLSRPSQHPNLINGMVHNSFDYASPLADVKLFMRGLEGEGEHEDEREREIPFSQLNSFQDLGASHRIKLRAFKKKEYTIEFKLVDKAAHHTTIMKTQINNFDGWALATTEDLAERVRQAEASCLWTPIIGDHLTTWQLANERLLGGKGHSLVELARWTSNRDGPGGALSSSSYDRGQSGRVPVSVPRGLVVSCVAYDLWLASDAKILAAIDELDRKRRALAARSIYLNPMSSQYISIGQSRQLLKEHCAKACSILKSCPLSGPLKAQLSQQLVHLFGRQALDSKEKLFAVRSSAVGEDSLETSAAGQMRTHLDARGLEAICRSVVDCWSSQFELEPVTYKTQNGLPFNLPMSVVVQELVQCQVAGVAATCDPVTGNRSQLEISANVGLGEGVVSGKQTDTVRVSLAPLEWSSRHEDHLGALRLEHAKDSVRKISTSAGGCCLSDKQIIALSNVLLQLRQMSSIKEREVEWGITGTTSTGGKSSSSSLSSSSSSTTTTTTTTDVEPLFHIHLLQSRPLTHLQRLSAEEVDHELDYGMPAPLDMVTRANLGEVMPGALSPMNSTYFQPITTSFATHKPYQGHHTRAPYVADAFGFHAGMAVMVVSYSDTVQRFSGLPEADGSAEIAKAAIYTMIGSTFDHLSDESSRKKMEQFYGEKVNPNCAKRRGGLMEILRLDLAFQASRLSLEFSLKRLKYPQENQILIDKLIERTYETHTPGDDRLVVDMAKRLYDKLTRETGILSKSWMLHIGATIVSMSFNMMSLKLLGSQPAYAGLSLTSSELLNDFSTLMRDPGEGGNRWASRSETLGEQTESGDISLLLEQLLESFLQDDQLELAKTFSQQQLYDHLIGGQSGSASSRLFRDFIERNGHRAFKEFCLATRTWSDDSSYIVRLLASRLKSFSAHEHQRNRQRRQQSASQHQARLAEVQAKLVRNRFLLVRYAIPKAQQATIRRERSKSLLIESVHKIRLALRQLGALLCLAGRLPNAELVFFLTIQELDAIVQGLGGQEEVNKDDQHHAQVSRAIYKARRRQQRARAFDKVTFPRPTMGFHEMVATIREQVAATTSSTGGRCSPTVFGPSAAGNGSPAWGQSPPSGRQVVTGLTSCGGRVTGRACVVSSLDEMDQVEENDILVTYSIDISWSVYFFALAGIVTEVGGIVSHGAVVAREYGIPTLCTAMGATSLFATGQLITLDADRGVCYLAEHEPPRPPPAAAAAAQADEAARK